MINTKVFLVGLFIVMLSIVGPMFIYPLLLVHNVCTPSLSAPGFFIFVISILSGMYIGFRIMASSVK